MGTKKDLEELVTKADLEGFVTKADLDLQIWEHSVVLKEQMLDLQQQVAGIQDDMRFRIWLPAVAIVTGVAAIITLSYVLSSFLS